MRPRYLSLAANTIRFMLMISCSTPRAAPTITAAIATDTAIATDSPAETTFVRRDSKSINAGDWAVIDVADLNDDGRTDVVTTSRTIFGLGLLLGQGDGTFVKTPDIEVAPSDYVRAADLNRDGYIDLVGAGEQLAVLLGNGDGTFVSPAYYPVGDSSPAKELNLFGLDIADVNADQIPDIMVANWGDSKLGVLLGQGDGTFQPAILYSCRTCVQVAAGDLDDDGDFDVCATSFAIGALGRVMVFLNDGTGVFNEPVEYVPNGNAHAIALGDLNADGALDIVTGDDGSEKISVLLGLGDGTFAEAQTYAAGNTHVVAIADLNNDGLLDVLSGAIDHPGVGLYLGTGTAELIETEGIKSDFGNGMAVADLDGDGKLDLVLSSADGPFQIVSIFLQE